MRRHGTIDVTDRPAIIEYRGGRLVTSYSVVDKGYDPFRYFSEERNIMRLVLGDIQFMGRHDDRDELIDLVIVPEYPSEQFRTLRDVMTFYGVIINEFADEPVVEIRAWDLVYTHLPWERGMALMRSVDLQNLSKFQRSTCSHIYKLDRLYREKLPNYTKTEMRHIVGAPIGARISLMPLVFGSV